MLWFCFAATILLTVKRCIGVRGSWMYAIFLSCCFLSLTYILASSTVAALKGSPFYEPSRILLRRALPSSVLFELSDVMVPTSISHATAVVVAITRDDAPKLRQSIAIVQSLMHNFKAYDFIIIENDSTDATQEILQEFARTDPRFLVESRNLSADNGDVTVHVDKKSSIGLMAALRNRGIELAFMLSYSSKLRHQWSADIIVIVDLDIIAIDIAGFFNAADAVLRGKMAGATANGVQQDGRYYDLYAFRSCNIRWNPHNGPLMRKVSSNEWLALMPLYTKDLAPFPVDSAFSGAAIYSSEMVFGTRVWEQPKALDGNLGPEIDSRYRIPTWRGDELVRILNDQGKRIRERTGHRAAGRRSGVVTTAGSNSVIELGRRDPESPHYFASEAVRLARKPWNVSDVTSTFPCVYSDAGARECEHVAFSACVNSRAHARGVPPIHMVPDWGVLYGAGRSPQLQRAGDRSKLVLYANGSELFHPLKVPQPRSRRGQPQYWKGPTPMGCNCELIKGALC